MDKIFFFVAILLELNRYQAIIIYHKEDKMDEEKWMTLIGFLYNLEHVEVNEDHPMAKFKRYDLYERYEAIGQLSDKTAREMLTESLNFRAN